MTIVYRVEYKEISDETQYDFPHGPYAHPGGVYLNDKLLSYHHANHDHPSAQTEKWAYGIQFNEIEWKNKLFGFDTLDKLKYWFEPVVADALEDYGFIISIYIVPKEFVINGTKQSIFNYDEAQRLESFPMHILKESIDA